MVKMNEIIFLSNHKVDPRYMPVPSSKIVPNWYQRTQSYTKGKRDPDEMTIKRCIPVFDAMTSGYTILLTADLFIKFEYENGLRGQRTQWSSLIDYPLIDHHAPEQFSTYPGVEKGFPANKFINPFSIITPPGYSCLFTQPMHQEKSPIKIFEAIVDTDKQHIVNFPFIYKDKDFEGIIPAGTPLVQVIPFKREKWKIDFDSKQGKKIFNKFSNYLGSNLFGQYRDSFWTRKEYK